jgi:23S rRNA-/tRNA-specific pseudouridylate synthase
MSIQSQINQLPLTDGVKVLSSNEDGLVALEKPIGVLSHPNSEAEKKRTLLEADYDYDNEVFTWENAAGEPQSAWLINRLDSPTSGVILIGLNLEISQLIKQCFATHKVLKTYYALVKRTPSRPAGAWNDVLKKDVKNGQRVIKQAQLVPAKTRYQVMKTPVGGFPICLIKLMPLTGRTHQLRVQCQKHGHPVVGDRTYGSFSFNREVAHETDERRMMLHSGETVVHYNYKGKIREFKAASELPEAFRNVMAFRPGLSHGRSTPKPSRKPIPNKRQTSRALAQRRFKH